MTETLVETSVGVVTPSSSSSLPITTTSTDSTIPFTSRTPSPSPSRTPSPSFSHGSGIYFLYKCMGLTIYTWMLSLILSVEAYYWYKLITFLFITPLIKYRTLYQTAQYDSHVKKQFIFSIIADSIASIYILYLQRTYLTGSYMCFFPLCTTLLYMMIEACEYILLDWGSGTYVVKMSSNPFDYMLVTVICMTFWFLGMTVDFMTPPTFWSFPKYIALWYVFDFTFGLGHYYSHNVPMMWKNHKTHHEYKRSDLNTFANFYAEISDSFMMNLGFLSSAIGAAILQGDSHRMLTDSGPVTVQTHSKYCSRHMHMIHYWEYDAIDLLFERTRMADYHNVHHNELNRNLAAVGFLSDQFFHQYAPDLKPYFPNLFNTEKKVE